tara:strand:- start:73 stop:726 length:654 start_codon:yes stop_codon:yes gene_type:complete
MAIVEDYGCREPLFVTFEGGEGCGKSSQVELFREFFELGYGPAIATREPGGDVVAEKIREVILDKDHIIGDHAELLLYGAARGQFVENIVEPNLDRGISVISDRFYDSTDAYQGAGRWINRRYIEQLNEMVAGDFDPDLTFVIDIDPRVGLKNRARDGNENRLDLENIEFHDRVNNRFREIAEENPERCVLIRYVDGIDNVQARIREEFSKKYLGRL